MTVKSQGVIRITGLFLPALCFLNIACGGGGGGTATPQTPPLTAPTNLRIDAATSTFDRLSLKWDSNPAPQANVEQSNNGLPFERIQSKIGNSNNAHIQIGQFPEDIYLVYRVSVSRNIDESGFSNEIQHHRTYRPPQGIYGFPAYDSSVRGILIGWTNQSLLGTETVIQRAPLLGSGALGAFQTLSTRSDMNDFRENYYYLDTNIAEGEKYVYRVFKQGQGGQGENADFAFNELTPVFNPTNLQSRIDPGGLHFTWSYDGNIATDFELWSRAPLDSNWNMVKKVPANQFFIDISNPPQGLYSYLIKATNPSIATSLSGISASVDVLVDSSLNALFDMRSSDVILPAGPMVLGRNKLWYIGGYQFGDTGSPDMASLIPRPDGKHWDPIRLTPGYFWGSPGLGLDDNDHPSFVYKSGSWPNGSLQCVTLDAAGGPIAEAMALGNPDVTSVGIKFDTLFDRSGSPNVLWKGDWLDDPDHRIYQFYYTRRSEGAWRTDALLIPSGYGNLYFYDVIQSLGVDGNLYFGGTTINMGMVFLGVSEAGAPPVWESIPADVPAWLYGNPMQLLARPNDVAAFLIEGFYGALKIHEMDKRDGNWSQSRILVDIENHSSDSTPMVAQSRDGQVQVISFKTNIGAMICVRKGSGEWQISQISGAGTYDDPKATSIQIFPYEEGGILVLMKNETALVPLGGGYISGNHFGQLIIKPK